MMEHFDLSTYYMNLNLLLNGHIAKSLDSTNGMTNPSRQSAKKASRYAVIKTTTSSGDLTLDCLPKIKRRRQGEVNKGRCCCKHRMHRIRGMYVYTILKIVLLLWALQPLANTGAL